MTGDLRHSFACETAFGRSKGHAMRWSRKPPGRWFAPCRDIARRRHDVVVTPTDDGRVALIVPGGQVAVLEVLAVGRLRGALRDAVFALNDPDTALDHCHVIAIARTGS